MPDTSHLVALLTRLSHERDYLAIAKTSAEIELRKVWIAQIEREIRDEESFLAKHGIATYSTSGDDDLSDDDLLNALN